MVAGCTQVMYVMAALADAKGQQHNFVLARVKVGEC